MNRGEAASRPVPQAAYERWLHALTGAGWSARRPEDFELVSVGEALGRVTAKPVTARWPSPRTDCAAMDGIAVRAADLAAAAPGLADSDLAAAAAADALAGWARPTDGPVRLPAGAFEWVDTGDPMPPGTDTVVVRERLLPREDGSVIIAPAAEAADHGRRAGHRASWRNVRSTGEDFAAGEVLVPAGRRLRPGHLAAVAAGGHATVAVARRPVVAIIPTGDEIRPVGTVPRFGDIIDTNSLMLAARCRQLSVEPLVSTVVPDDPDALAVELRRAAGQVDLVLVIAGSSRGRGDHAGAVIAQVGGVAVAGVAVRPGHPALLGHAKRPAAGNAGHQAGIAPVIGLPGYPLATAVIFELFAAPMLAALTGQAPARDRVRARLDRDWASPADVEDWVLVTLAGDPAGGAPMATPARRGASSISQLARADAWWPVPAGLGTFTAGAEIEVIPIQGGD